MRRWLSSLHSELNRESSESSRIRRWSQTYAFFVILIRVNSRDSAVPSPVHQRVRTCRPKLPRSSSGTSSPTTGGFPSRWCAARARGCGTTRATAISTSSPAGAATCSATVRRAVVAAVQEQVAKLIHVPNTWHMEAQGRWAKLLSERSFGGQAFFCNSRRRGQRGGDQARPPAHAAASATRSSRSKAASTAAPTAPSPPRPSRSITKASARCCPASSTPRSAISTPCAKLVDDETAAILVEPIQGEGGIRIPPAGLPAGPAAARRRARPGADLRRSASRLRPHGQVVRLPALRRRARRDDAGQEPVRRHRRRRDARPARRSPPACKPGMHAATFGGNPIAARAGIATIETIEQDGLLERADAARRACSAQLLEPLVDELPHVREVRQMRPDDRHRADRSTPRRSCEQCMDQRLLINVTQGNVIRLLPAMTLDGRRRSARAARSWRMRFASFTPIVARVATSRS